MNYILAKKQERINAILDKFENNSIPEEVFEKAIADFDLEVYSEKSLELFKAEVISSGKKEDIEKAQKDLSKLIKIRKRDKTGKISTYYVKPKDYDSHTGEDTAEIEATIKRQKSLIANPKSPASAVRRAQEILKVEEAKLAKIKGEKAPNKPAVRSKLEELKAELSTQEWYRKDEIDTMGYVSGRTDNKITSLKKKISALEDSKSSDAKSSNVSNKLLKQDFLSSQEYQKVKNLKGFNKEDYKWNGDLYEKKSQASKIAAKADENLSKWDDKLLKNTVAEMVKEGRDPEKLPLSKLLDEMKKREITVSGVKKIDPPKEVKNPNIRFDDKKTLNSILKSIKSSKSVKHTFKARPNGGWYLKIQPIYKEDDFGLGIGYSVPEKGSKNKDYFSINSHGGDDSRPGNIWNSSRSKQDGPLEGAGWYSFTDKEAIESANEAIKRFEKNVADKKAEEQSKSQNNSNDPHQILNSLENDKTYQKLLSDFKIYAKKSGVVVNSPRVSTKGGDTHIHIKVDVPRHFRHPSEYPNTSESSWGSYSKYEEAESDLYDFLEKKFKSSKTPVEIYAS